MDKTRRQSRKMTDAEWERIKHTCLYDDKRMSLFNQLAVIHAKCDTDSMSLKDVDLWHELHEKLLDREWEILAENTKYY